MFEKQIANGAKWLDKEIPGWELKIDLSKFDINSACKCVLGQLFGDYEEGVQFYYDSGGNPEDDWAGECGFVVPFPARQDVPYPWKTLDDEWIDFIKARLDAGVQLPD